MILATHNPDESLLDSLQGHALRYLLDEVDPGTGLVADSTMPGTVCSIAAVDPVCGDDVLYACVYRADRVILELACLSNQFTIYVNVQVIDLGSRRCAENKFVYSFFHLLRMTLYAASFRIGAFY